jgi:hypothetical protein
VDQLVIGLQLTQLHSQLEAEKVATAVRLEEKHSEEKNFVNTMNSMGFGKGHHHKNIA